MGQCTWAKQSNIGSKGQSKRMRGSIVFLGFALMMAVALIKFDMPIWSRAFVFLPLLIAATGALSGIHQTCFMAALKGVREMDDGDHQIADPEERKRIKQEAWRVMYESLATASAATLLIFLAP